MSRWNIKHGKWWMIQWAFDSWISLGIHIDFKHRIASVTGEGYGPYIDFHIGFIIVSLGNKPYYSSVISANCIGRGGAITDGDSQ